MALWTNGESAPFVVGEPGLILLVESYLKISIYFTYTCLKFIKETAGKFIDESLLLEQGT